jgi:hypothetical protein
MRRAPGALSPQPTVLDEANPLDAAAFGDAIAWLRPLRERHGEPVQIGLVVRDGDDAMPRLVTSTVPKDTTRLTLGTDASGLLTVVLETPSGLYSMPADGSDPMSRVPGTTRRDQAPGLRAGRLSFARTKRGRLTVRVGSLTSPHSRVLWIGLAGAGIADTAISDPRTVVFQTFQRPSKHGTQFDVRVSRPHGYSRELLRQISSGGEGQAGVGRATVSADGQQVTVNRWDQLDGQPHDVTTFALPSRQQLGRTADPALPQMATIFSLLPLTSGGFAAVTDSGPFYLV